MHDTLEARENSASSSGSISSHHKQYMIILTTTNLNLDSSLIHRSNCFQSSHTGHNGFNALLLLYILQIVPEGWAMRPFHCTRPHL
mmetsp:Transcript_3560/g.7762  ORF Transcript_3560/g.7762 Transcript_3560/m.7762 type:complete len:86 (-) Transcript_3560:464-721(-)